MRGTDLLAPIGVALAFGHAALSRFQPELMAKLPGSTWAWYAGFAALVLLHAILRRDAIVSVFGRRQLLYGGNALLFSSVVLAILVGVNYLAARHPKRWDLTKEKRYSLSDQTLKVLSGLGEDVKLTYFQRKEGLQGARERMKEIAAVSPRLKIEYVDPVAQPIVAKQNDVQFVPTLIFERGSRKEKIQNDSEQDVVNALIKVTRDGKKTVCFVAGEGERDPDQGGEQGLASLKAALTKGQYEVQKISLMQEGKVPAVCTVVVVAGPQKDLVAPAIDALRTFVKGSGKLLLAVEPELDGGFPALAAFAKEWNIELGKDVVVDVSPVGQLFGTSELMPLSGPPISNYPYHAITKDFPVATAFPTVRTAKAGTGAPPEGVVAQDLVKSSEQSWAETDLALKGSVAYEEGKDARGPVSLAAVATYKAPAPTPAPSPAADAAPEPPRPEGRVVVFGDVDWMTDGFVGFQGNADLALNTLAWLSEDADLIAIRPKEPNDQKMFLTEHQQLNVVLGVFALPLFFVVAGIASWWRRRG